MLHLIFAANIDDAILQRIDTGNALVFMEKAVLRTLKNSLSGKQIQEVLTYSKAYVLVDQLAERGITAEELVDGIEIINTADLVDLCVKFPVIHSWT